MRIPAPTALPDQRRYQFRKFRRVWCVALLACLGAIAAVAQQADSSKLPDAPSTSAQQEQPSGQFNTGIGFVDLLQRRSLFFPDLATTTGPLGTGGKFKLFVNNSISGFGIAASAASAGIGQARDVPEGYGQGAEGYGKRFGAIMARNASNNFFGTFLLASALHQDPRFFVRSHLSFGDSVKYSLQRMFITRKDSGGDTFNWSGLLGPLASEGLANTYYPDRQRTVGDTFTRYGIDLASRAGGNLLRQYWPTINKSLRLPHPTATQPTKTTAAPLPSGSATVSGSRPVFGGTYADLTPEQRKLVDDWIKRYNKKTGKNLKAEPAYNTIPISTRTTFEAVTHALATSKVTDKDGRPQGTVLDMVQHLETVRGKVPGAKGDLQFRVYAIMRPNAYDRLTNSQQFRRDRDNSVFHYGYPVNLRQGNGYPSIQVSMSRDHSRADIDVDYRSSGFPVGLFNGHLSAANSDVRAGNNYERHDKRWSGLGNWWRNLFGVPIEEDSSFHADPEQNMAESPHLNSSAYLSAVVADFLSTWLVDKKPNIAAAYFAPQSFACVGPDAANGSKSNQPVPTRLWNDMEEIQTLVGNPAKLSDAVVPVDLGGTGMTPVTEDPEPFSLAKVPPALARDFDCSETPAPQDDAGEYYAAAFRLKVPGAASGSNLLLWTKQGPYWKIVSIQYDPELLRAQAVPDDSEVKVGGAAQPEVPATDSQLLTTQAAFLDTLFLKKDSEGAFQYFAPSAYACIDTQRGMDQQPRSDSAAEAADLKADLKAIASNSRNGSALGEVIEKYDPENPSLKPIQHPNSEAYLLTDMPADEAQQFMCNPAASGAAASESAVASTSAGPFYATFLHMIEPGEENAGLGLLWAKVNGEWKIVAYGVDEP